MHSCRVGPYAILVLALVWQLGCGGDQSNTVTQPPPTPVLSSMAVSPATATLVRGSAKQFTAIGTYSDGTTKDLTSAVTWSSSNLCVAPVTNSGLLTANAAGGVADVTAASGSMTSSATVQVAASQIESVYVTNNALFAVGGVSIIDTLAATPCVVGTGFVSDNAGLTAHGIVISPDGKRAYITLVHFFEIVIIDTTSMPPQQNGIVLGFQNCASAVGPFAIAVSPDGTRAYSTNVGCGTLDIIDTTAAPPTITDHLTIGGGGVHDVAVSSDGTRAYVTVNDGSGGPGSLAIVDITASPPAVLSTVAVGIAPAGVVASPDGTRVYVVNSCLSGSCSAPGTVSVIDTTLSTPAVVSTVTVGQVPNEIAITPDGKRLYVSNTNANVLLSGGDVSVIDTTASPPSVIATVDVPSPRGLAANTSGSRVYVVSALSSVSSQGSLYVVDTSTNAILLAVPVGLNADQVAIKSN
jgi:DNA-binding beta-propeller fold protein YncE